MPTPSLLPRLPLVYFGLVGGSGAVFPYMALALSRKGFTPTEVSALIGLLPLVSLLATPAWSLAADRHGLGIGLLRAVTALSVLTALGLGLVGPSFPAAAALLAALSVLRSPVPPVMDAMAVRALEAAGAPHAYGRVRRWASVGFAACALGASALWTVVDAPGLPLFVGAAAWGLGVISLGGLRGGGATRPRAGVLVALRALLRRPGMAALLLALPLHGMGLGAYDAWYAVLIDDLGLPSTWTGASLGVGIAVEVGVLSAGAAALRGRRPERLVLLGVGSGALRWAITAATAHPLVLTGAQVLHGLGFALFWLAGTEHMRQQAPPALRTSAQGLLLVGAYGLGPLLCSAVAAAVVETWGARALFAVAAGASVGATALVAVAAARAQPAPAWTAAGEEGA